MTTFFLRLFISRTARGEPTKDSPHGPHNNKCACFFGACRVQFFLRLFIYFHFRVKNMELVKSVFYELFFHLFPDTAKTRKFFCRFPLFFLRLFISRGLGNS